jgi:hypothetical protein
VVKVATLKEQARQYERDGDLDKALAIYGHILTHLEGTPAIKGQLPLYVKVGDLHLKQGDTESAIAMYQRAAGHYAEHGSAKSVIALCLKILRVAPKHTTVYLTYARRLLEFDHVGAARDVLVDFAERASLVKPLESLQRLTDRPEAEVRPVLERMLAGVRNSGAAAAVEEKAVEEAEAPSVEEAGPLGLERDVWPASSGEAASDTEASPDQYLEPTLPAEYEEAEPSPVTASSESDMEAPREEPPIWGEEPEPQTSSEDLPWLTGETRPSAPRAEPPVSLHEPVGEPEAPPRGMPERRPFSSFAREAERRRSSSRIWIIAAVIFIIVALGGAFVKLGVIPSDLRGIFGLGGDRPPPGEAAGPGATSTEQVPAVLADSLRGVTADSAGPVDTGGVDSLPALELGDTLSGSAVADSLPVEAGEPREESGDPGSGLEAEDPAPVTGTVARPPPAPAARTAQRTPLPAGAALTAPVILVRGLVVDSATEFLSGDLVGVRVIHRLESGDPLILRAVPVGGGMADSATAGIPRVTTLRGDTAFGTVMFGGYLVNARGKIAASRLDSLLRQLIRLQPQD